MKRLRKTITTKHFGKTVFIKDIKLLGQPRALKWVPCLFMGNFEHLVVKSYNSPFSGFYKRYFDDGIDITYGCKRGLNSFIVFLKWFNPAIFFTFLISMT